METILTQYYQSPYGELLLGSFGDKLCLCDWMLNEKRRVTVDKRIRQVLHADYEEGTSEVIARAIIQLDEYFACKRTIFDVPLLAVGTEFQRTVWQELQNIPYGKTVSYGELSRKLGNPKAVRAVAAANGANALSILIPCHRVVGSNHTLIGYAGELGIHSARKQDNAQSHHTDELRFFGVVELQSESVAAEKHAHHKKK